MTPVERYQELQNIADSAGSQRQISFAREGKPGTHKLGDWTWDLDYISKSPQELVIGYWVSSTGIDTERIKLPTDSDYSPEQRQDLVGRVVKAIDQLKKWNKLSDKQ